jgi:hydrogenase nickel incorporation protein HypA/HybF
VHELSYCEGVLDAVERRAGGRQVAAVGVRIGAVHRVVAAAFQQSFAIAAAGGPAADAVTSLVVVPVRGHCVDCTGDFTSADPAPACPACGSLRVRVEGGDEVVLEWLEYVDTELPESDAERVPAHSHDGEG